MIRPWGSYRIIHRDEHCVVKKIIINPRSRMSLQWHSLRGEIWSFISGNGEVIINGLRIKVRPGSFLKVESLDIHRLINPNSKPLCLIEMQHGILIDEEDIHRVEDDYGRVK